MAAIQFERGQEGHLSLAARWPGAKPVEEPCSLHPVTGTWTEVPEQTLVSFSLTAAHTRKYTALRINREHHFASLVDPNSNNLP